MKRGLYVLILILCIASVLAEEIKFNSTVQLDWLNNETFRIKIGGTTVKDKGGDDVDFNVSQQSEKKYNFTLKREYDALNLSKEFKSVQSSINKLSKSYNFSEKLLNVTAAHARVVTNYEACKDEKRVCTSGLKNMSDKYSTCDNYLDSCFNEKDILNNNRTICLDDLEDANEKSKNNTVIFVVLAIGGAAVGYFLKDYENKKRVPKTMQDLGYSGQVTSQKPKW